MSHDATNWAIRQRGLKPAAKLVLWHLCDRYHPDNGCFPSQDRLAEDCELSRSSLNVQLEALEGAGLIARRQRRQQGSNRQQSTLYSFAFERDFIAKVSEKPCPDSGHGQEEAVSRKTGEPCPENGESRVQNLDSNSVREPVREPVTERERERESAEEENPKAVEQAFKRWYATWPTFVTDSEPAARKAWAALTAAERVKAAELSAAYVEAAKASGRKFVCSAGAYLSEKRWEKLDAIAKPAAVAPVVAGGKIAVPVFGPAWAAARHMAFLAGARPVDLPEDLRETVRVAYAACTRRGPLAAQKYAERRGLGVDADGELIFPADFEAMEHQRLTMAEGYPEANRLHNAAGNRGSVTINPELEPLKAFCEAVPVGSAMWDAWRDWHAENFLPFVPDTGAMRVVYFPKGGPQGLDEFERAARSLLARGANDDAA
ncbi:hypothetical protein GN325_20655 [Agrobacterium vitis]|uniref:helix-turn-helix domain-containing protein n=1 Tax=Agrobacterium vitis TaxID=373 RepID=UPI00132540F6|nr:hypothetical protein [Agrobacterium vitis]